MSRLSRPRQPLRAAPWRAGARLTQVVVYGLLASLEHGRCCSRSIGSVNHLVQTPIDVAYPPKYLPLSDYQPSLHAWRYIFVDLGNDTFRPYLNSVIVASFQYLAGPSSSVSMAAYALAGSGTGRALGSVVDFILLLAASCWRWRSPEIDWRHRRPGGACPVFSCCGALGPPFPLAALGNGDILFWIISQRILPPVVAAIPDLRHVPETASARYPYALIVTYMTVNLPIVVWLMYDFFAAVPKDLEESAQLDGASRFRIFIGIVLPLAKPGLIATGLLVLILTWNEYLLASSSPPPRPRPFPCWWPPRTPPAVRNGGTCRC